jgi:signal transduction histidine kinase
VVGTGAKRSIQEEYRNEDGMHRDPAIQIVCGDPELTREYLQELQSAGESYRLRPIAGSAEAQLRAHPAVILFDESGLQSSAQESSFESIVALMADKAPVVVVASPIRQLELTRLLTSGAVDFVARTGIFVPVAVGLVERRIRLAGSGNDTSGRGKEMAGDFGEILRHEVNNPLTGILGNAEMLLARRDRLPASAVERVETIAELAVRLRETVRRLSSICEAGHDPVRSS